MKFFRGNKKELPAQNSSKSTSMADICDTIDVEDYKSTFLESKNISISEDRVNAANSNISPLPRIQIQNELKRKLLGNSHDNLKCTPNQMAKNDSNTHLYDDSSHFVNHGQTSENSSFGSSSIGTWESSQNQDYLGHVSKSFGQNIAEIDMTDNSSSSVLEVSTNVSSSVGTVPSYTNLSSLRNDAAYHKIAVQQRNRRAPRRNKKAHSSSRGHPFAPCSSATTNHHAMNNNIHTTNVSNNSTMLDCFSGLQHHDLPTMAEVSTDFEQLEERMIVTRQKDALTKLEKEGKFSCNQLSFALVSSMTNPTSSNVLISTTTTTTLNTNQNESSFSCARVINTNNNAADKSNHETHQCNWKQDRTHNGNEIDCCNNVTMNSNLIVGSGSGRPYAPMLSGDPEFISTQSLKTPKTDYSSSHCQNPKINQLIQEMKMVSFKKRTTSANFDDGPEEVNNGFNDVSLNFSPENNEPIHSESVITRISTMNPFTYNPVFTCGSPTSILPKNQCKDQTVPSTKFSLQQQKVNKVPEPQTCTGQFHFSLSSLFRFGGGGNSNTTTLSDNKNNSSNRKKNLVKTSNLKHHQHKSTEEETNYMHSTTSFLAANNKTKKITCQETSLKPVKGSSTSENFVKPVPRHTPIQTQHDKSLHTSNQPCYEADNSHQQTIHDGQSLLDRRLIYKNMTSANITEACPNNVYNHFNKNNNNNVNDISQYVVTHSQLLLSSDRLSYPYAPPDILHNSNRYDKKSCSLSDFWSHDQYPKDERLTNSKDVITTNNNTESHFPQFLSSLTDSMSRPYANICYNNGSDLVTSTNAKKGHNRTFLNVMSKMSQSMIMLHSCSNNNNLSSQSHINNKGDQLAPLENDDVFSQSTIKNNLVTDDLDILTCNSAPVCNNIIDMSKMQVFLAKTQKRNVIGHTQTNLTTESNPNISSSLYTFGDSPLDNLCNKPHDFTINESKNQSSVPLHRNRYVPSAKTSLLAKLRCSLRRKCGPIQLDITKNEAKNHTSLSCENDKSSFSSMQIGPSPNGNLSKNDNHDIVDKNHKNNNKDVLLVRDGSNTYNIFSKSNDTSPNTNRVKGYSVSTRYTRANTADDLGEFLFPLSPLSVSSLFPKTSGMGKQIYCDKNDTTGPLNNLSNKSPKINNDKMSKYEPKIDYPGTNHVNNDKMSKYEPKIDYPGTNHVNNDNNLKQNKGAYVDTVCLPTCPSKHLDVIETNPPYISNENDILSEINRLWEYNTQNISERHLSNATTNDTVNERKPKNKDINVFITHLESPTRPGCPSSHNPTTTLSPLINNSNDPLTSSKKIEKDSFTNNFNDNKFNSNSQVIALITSSNTSTTNTCTISTSSQRNTTIEPSTTYVYNGFILRDPQKVPTCASDTNISPINDGLLFNRRVSTATNIVLKLPTQNYVKTTHYDNDKKQDTHKNSVDSSSSSYSSLFVTTTPQHHNIDDKVQSSIITNPIFHDTRGIINIGERNNSTLPKSKNYVCFPSPKSDNSLGPEINFISPPFADTKDQSKGDKKTLHNIMREHPPILTARPKSCFIMQPSPNNHINNIPQPCSPQRDKNVKQKAITNNKPPLHAKSLGVSNRILPASSINSGYETPVMTEDRSLLQVSKNDPLTMCVTSSSSTLSLIKQNKRPWSTHNTSLSSDEMVQQLEFASENGSPLLSAMTEIQTNAKLNDGSLPVIKEPINEIIRTDKTTANNIINMNNTTIKRNRVRDMINTFQHLSTK